MDHTIDETTLEEAEMTSVAGVPAGASVSEADEHVAATREEFIAETLAWCAEVFGVTRVRFVRPLEAGGWRVYTRQGESIVTHAADYAESAMAYTVGLGRQPLLVTRPRISRVDGSGLRPIALSSYLGIPIVVQDRLIGVIEFAGEVRPDMESALYTALPHLANAGARMLHDPKLTQRPEITLQSLLVLDAATWTTGDIVLTPEELAFLARVIGPTAVNDIAGATGIEPVRAVELAIELAQRGLVAVRAEG
jgi:GAF domain-containing protein